MSELVESIQCNSCGRPYERRVAIELEPGERESRRAPLDHCPDGGSDHAAFRSAFQPGTERSR